MSPQSCNQTKSEDLNVELRKEVLYNGFYYDVTDFMSKHPGGRVIEFYTEKGEDATQAIDQFHFRFSKKVLAIMGSFKRRPADLQEVFPDKRDLSRHEALSKDFNNLFEELLQEGYFEPSYRHVLLRLLEPIALVFLILGFTLEEMPFYLRLPVCIFGGFAFSRFGWIQHEGGHRSLTGHPKVDRLIQDFSMCFVLGASSIWWNSQHNRHHAMPQRLQHDVDLSSLPFVAFNKREVIKREQVSIFFMKFQGILYWTIDLLLVIIAWKCYIHPRCQIRKKAYFEMFLNSSTYLFFWYFNALDFFIASYFFAFIFALNFSLNHSHLEVVDEPTHWVEYSLTHTANIKPSMICDYFMGYLNYQIEHHLFISMPQFRQREICHRVKALADKHGLPYRVFSYFEAVKLSMDNLYHVGKELSEKQDWPEMEKQ